MPVETEQDPEVVRGRDQLFLVHTKQSVVVRYAGDKGGETAPVLKVG